MRMESIWEIMSNNSIQQDNKKEFELNDKYFSNLYRKVMNRINGEKVIMTDVYFFEHSFNEKEIVWGESSFFQVKGILNL